LKNECDNGGIPFFEEIANLGAGSCSNCISDGSSSILIIEDDCSVTLETPMFGDLIYAYDGNILSVSAPLIN
jgi:hypothetical protein